MDIKKIILEEVNDFKWMEEADHLSREYINGKAMEFNPPIDDEDYLDNILDELREMGFMVNFSSRSIMSNWEVGEDYIVGLYAEDGNIVWTSDIFESYQEHIDDYAGKPVEVLNGWDLFSHYNFTG